MKNGTLKGIYPEIQPLIESLELYFTKSSWQIKIHFALNKTADGDCLGVETISFTF